jgi:hypothetical protein
MAVLAIQFDNPAPPAAPTSGVKLYLGDDGKFKALHPDGTVKGIDGGVTSWADLLDKPTEFPPSAHPHVASEITDFETAANDAITILDAGFF